MNRENSQSLQNSVSSYKTVSQSLVTSNETDSQCSSSSWDVQSSGEVWSPDSSQSTDSDG